MADAGALDWLAATPLSATMRTASWLYPAVEIVHIAGFSVLVGSVVLFDLRVLGFARALPVAELGRHLLRWALMSTLLVVPAGLLLFSAHPVELANNPDLAEAHPDRGGRPECAGVPLPALSHGRGLGPGTAGATRRTRRGGLVDPAVAGHHQLRPPAGLSVGRCRGPAGR